MRVFITGASGHIGSAVIPELIKAGHQVVGLARSDTSAAALEAVGAEVHRGDLDDLDSLKEAATASDGVIHLAYKIEEIRSGNFDGANDADMRAIEALGAGLAGTDKPFVGTSITLTLTFSGIAGIGTESDAATAGPRAEAENAMLALADRGVRSSAVRLPATVYGSLDHKGWIPTLIAIARRKGHAGSVGDGSNRWPAVHTLDAARLYRLAIEGAPARSRVHAVTDEGVPFREIAKAIGRNLDLPTISIPPEDVADYFQYLSWSVPLDNPTSSALTQKLLGWTPTHPGLIEDLDHGHYFEQESPAPARSALEPSSPT
jgi:nucleoside-diphosphate-sugar epimerase